MTEAEFFDRLRRTPRLWEITPGGALRMRTSLGLFCPISACTGQRWHIHEPVWAARLILGLDGVFADMIVTAADSPQGAPRLRRQLIIACGIHGGRQ